MKTPRSPGPLAFLLLLAACNPIDGSFPNRGPGTPATTAEVRGRLLLPSGTAAAAARVLLYKDQAVVAEAATAADGTFSFPSAPLGVAQLIADDRAGLALVRGVAVEAFGINDSGDLVLAPQAQFPQLLLLSGLGFEERLSQIDGGCAEVVFNDAMTLAYCLGPQGETPMSDLVELDLRTGALRSLLTDLFPDAVDPLRTPRDRLEQGRRPSGALRLLDDGTLLIRTQRVGRDRDIVRLDPVLGLRHSVAALEAPQGDYFAPRPAVARPSLDAFVSHNGALFHVEREWTGADRPEINWLFSVGLLGPVRLVPFNTDPGPELVQKVSFLGDRAVFQALWSDVRPELAYHREAYTLELSTGTTTTATFFQKPEGIQQIDWDSAVALDPDRAVAVGITAEGRFHLLLIDGSDGLVRDVAEFESELVASNLESPTLLLSPDYTEVSVIGYSNFSSFSRIDLASGQVRVVPVERGRIQGLLEIGYVGAHALRWFDQLESEEPVLALIEDTPVGQLQRRVFAADLGFLPKVDHTRSPAGDREALLIIDPATAKRELLEGPAGAPIETFARRAYITSNRESPRYSPDGSWLYFTAVDPLSSQVQIFRTPTNGGP